MKKPTITRHKKNHYEINITGNRDYRSPDIDIIVTVDDKDKLVLVIPKSQRCYGYEKTVEQQGFTKIVFT